MSQENVEAVRSIWEALNEDPPRVLLEAFDEQGLGKRAANIGPPS